MVSPPPVRQLVVLAHPEPGSFCASIARRWQERARRNRQTCELRDLYAEGFDPVLRAGEQPGKPGYAPQAANLEEGQRLSDLDVLVFVYPVWFGTPPAMLKGYLERVVGSGISFDGEGAQRHPLAKVRLVQVSTSALSEPQLAEKGISGALHTIFDSYVAEVFGAREAYHLHLDSIDESISKHDAAVQLRRVDELADRVCAEANAGRWERARAEMPGGRNAGGA